MEELQKQLETEKGKVEKLNAELQSKVNACNMQMLENAKLQKELEEVKENSSKLKTEVEKSYKKGVQEGAKEKDALLKEIEDYKQKYETTNGS